MKELLNHYKCTSKQEVYAVLIDKYRKCFTIAASFGFRMLEYWEQDELIATLDPYDPAYTFFSTMGFAETV